MSTHAMTEEDVADMFAVAHEDNFLKDGDIGTSLTKRRDLAAFLLLDSLVPGTGDIVGSAEHDELYLDVTLAELAQAGISEAQVQILLRCGVFCSDHHLKMFV